MRSFHILIRKSFVGVFDNSGHLSWNSQTWLKDFGQSKVIDFGAFWVFGYEKRFGHFPLPTSWYTWYLLFRQPSTACRHYQYLSLLAINKSINLCTCCHRMCAHISSQVTWLNVVELFYFYPSTLDVVWWTITWRERWLRQPTPPLSSHSQGQTKTKQKRLLFA